MQKYQNILSLLSKIDVRDKKTSKAQREQQLFQATIYVAEVVRNEIKTFHHVDVLSMSTREFSLVCSFISRTQTKINWSVPIFWV